MDTTYCYGTIMGVIQRCSLDTSLADFIYREMVFFVIRDQVLRDP